MFSMMASGCRKTRRLSISAKPTVQDVVVVRDSRPGMMQYGLGGILNQSLNLGSHGVNSAAVYGNMPTSWPVLRPP